MSVEAFFARLAAHEPARPALVGRDHTVSYGELRTEMARVTAMLGERGTRIVATLLDNGPAWAIADLAALRAGIVHVPIPGFFTPQQTAFVLDAAGVDTLVARAPLPQWRAQHCAVAGERVALCTRAPRHRAPVHPGTAKITFTSGTTGTPKGVCLSAASMLAVADGLARATSALSITRHLCALPLAVLLENVAGLYAPLSTGAASVVLPTQDAGLQGSSQFDPAKLEAAVQAHAAQSVIVLPQMLRAWSAWRRARDGATASAGAMGGSRARALRFIAVGGAPVGIAAIASARAAGLPAYEGYGLSEGASVQALNLPDADRVGSVGRALPHARVRIAADGEIEVAGSVMLGYLGEHPLATAPSRRDANGGEETWWQTGDVGTIDAEGYIHVHGRRGNILITAYGRNVSPEWIETALAAQPAIAQAVVQGDGKPALEAVLWPAHTGIGDDALARAVAGANADLPDYARVRRFVRARVPFTSEAGVCTPNGRPQRRAIEVMHAAAFANDRGACDVAA